MRLLVSVRSVAEAHQVLGEPVDIIDIKEPKRGSLGRAEWTEIQSIFDFVAGRRALSVALGELSEWMTSDLSLAEMPPVSFAKFGMSGLAQEPQWRLQWQKLWSQMPTGVIPVAVAYVDHQLCQAPAPAEIIDFAVEVGCGVVLLDTFFKRRGRLLDYLTRSQLESLIGRVHAHEMLIALAGSISFDQVPKVADLPADILAVRGAVCGRGRAGLIDAKKIRKFWNLMTRSQQPI